MMDTASLPKSAMVDTGVFLRFLGDRPDDPDAPACKAFCEAMLEQGHVLYVAAPTLAELIRQSGERSPRVKGVVVVPFDDRAAELLGTRMPLARTGALRSAAMIMACAARSRTGAFVTLDVADHLPLAAGLEIAVRRPQDFATEQLDLPGLLPPPAPDPPALDAAPEPPELPAAEPPEPEPPAPEPPPTRQLALPW